MKNKDINPEDLTQADINQIAFEIREQKAKPEDARRLLRQFCDFYDRDQTIPYVLNMHFRDSFRVYLAGKQNLESALGLKRKKARPKADPKIRTEMATEVLRLRFLEKVTHEDARERVSKKFGWVESIVSEAWKAHKQEALICLRLERVVDGKPWNSDEVKRLTKIFGKEPWFISPEKSATKPD